MIWPSDKEALYEACPIYCFLLKTIFDEDFVCNVDLSKFEKRRDERSRKEFLGLTICKLVTLGLKYQSQEYCNYC